MPRKFSEKPNRHITHFYKLYDYEAQDVTSINATIRLILPKAYQFKFRK